MAQPEAPQQQQELKRIAVFCGSNSGNKPAYAAAARALGVEMAKQGIGLTYGGGTVGLMGEVARAVLNATGGQQDSVLGYIPEALAPREVSGEMIGVVHYTKDMHERKRLMAENCNGFIGLPGGFGTLEELLEVITWQQLGFHKKPVALLNIDGFYDPLLQFFNQCVDQGFIKPQHNKVIVSSDPVELITLMRQHQPPISYVDLMRIQAENGATAGP